MANPIYIASDHAGFLLKEELKKRSPHLPWQDLGPENTDRVDYPDYADLVARKVQEGAIGVLVCGSGQGMAMRANKYSNVRAALCWNAEIAKLSREHNDANILCLGERVMNWDDCEASVKAFLETEFAGGRHADRVAKIKKPTT